MSEYYCKSFRVGDSSSSSTCVHSDRYDQRGLKQIGIHCGGNFRGQKNPCRGYEENNNLVFPKIETQDEEYFKQFKCSIHTEAGEHCPEMPVIQMGDVFLCERCLENVKNGAYDK